MTVTEGGGEPVTPPIEDTFEFSLKAWTKGDLVLGYDPTTRQPIETESDEMEQLIRVALDHFMETGKVLRQNPRR